LREIAPISLIIAFALILRLWRLNLPKGYIFDEVYYAKNANSLIRNGVELNAQGQAEFIVHPPLGKWLIGIGIKVFGNDEFGWRISAAVIGTLSVVLIYLITKELFKSAQYIFLPSLVYLLSWSGWIFTSGGWDRQSGSNVFTSLWKYHTAILDFHRNLVETHSYAANPWSWLILGRPTSFFYETPSGCGVSSCSQEILAIGTPMLWWAGIFAIALTFGFFVTNRDRISMIILAGIAGTYLPWFLIQSRTTFYFYAMSILPF